MAYKQYDKMHMDTPTHIQAMNPSQMWGDHYADKGGYKGPHQNAVRDPYEKNANWRPPAPVSGGGSSSSSVQAADTAPQPSGPDYGAIAHKIEQSLRDSLNESIAARKDAYNSTKATYDKNLEAQMGQLKDAYDFGSGKVNAGADSSLQQAYLNKMDNMRTLPQMMSAQGLTGGMTETTNARLLNAYGNNRNNIERGRADNLADLLNVYQTNTGKAQQDYNTRLAEAYNQMKQGIAADRAAFNQQLSNIMGYLR